MLGDRIGYDQFGCLQGEIFSSLMPGGKQTVYLPTYRKRYFGTADRHSTYRDINVFAASEDGTLVHVATRSMINGCTQLRYGSVLYGNGQLHCVSSHDMLLQHLGDDGNVPRNVSITLTTKKSTIRCFFHVSPNAQTSVKNDEACGWLMRFASAEVNMDLHKARATMLLWYPHKGIESANPEPLLKPLKPLYQCEKVTLTLDDEDCCVSELAGSKGSSLALLSSIESSEIQIPDGFVISVPAFRHQIGSNVNLRKSVAMIRIACDDSLQVACERAEKLFKNEEIDAEIVAAVKREMGKITQKSSGEIRWAVRSSAVVEEDSEHLLTILDCKSEQEVLKAVAACWASLYSFDRVQYRLTHGIQLDGDMGVVVQKMLNPEVEGIMYTCHPRTGDLSRMLLEFPSSQKSMVLKRSFDGKITVDGKTLELSVDQAQSLGEIGVDLERRCGSSMEIKWIIQQGKVHLLQIRPVSLDSWTDFELEHEFDTPVLNGQDVFTTANVKDAIPSAMTSLSNTIVKRALDGPRCADRSLLTRNHNVFLNVKNVLMNIMPKYAKGTLHLAAFGHEEPLLRHGNLKPAMILLKEVVPCLKHVKAIVNRSKQFTEIPIDIKVGMSLKETHEAITKYLETLQEMCRAHAAATQATTFYQSAAMVALAGSLEEFTSDHYHDFALILPSSEQSCCIPEAAVKAIEESGKIEEFVCLDAPSGRKWLEVNVPKASIALERFLETHGHRSLQEFELMGETWASKPEILVGVVQALCTVNSSGKPQRGLRSRKVMKSLKTPLGSIRRWLLKYLVVKSRRSQRIAEDIKSDLAQSVDRLRKAFRVLGEGLAEIGRLPHRDLIFHLTKFEVSQIVNCNNHELVAKALHRKRLFPKWNSYRYAEFLQGLPQPEVFAPVGKTLGGDVFLKGTPAFNGEAQARCCVVNKVSDIAQMKPGDILVTRGADAGWSPFFPILSGVVLERSGLLSNGAAVAKEFGLPCLVGVEEATRHFKTGDVVAISGKFGTLRLISRGNER
ncbi:PREDICTED: putative phosphoenolpyruvate synthase [Nicrophorus vespilloides]|uniref:Phosphoenolpyruvate synthase n=1 Tax=Nicrophorus vespilloides TaxID=110193 RepID=A0ABM1M6T0_NICVS|nr:PREDICTED: putative phosphoenolpyruvate synthase [Nicrophorus vespilloides]